MDVGRLIDHILESKRNRTPYLFKNILPKVPKWDNFINHLNSQYHNKDVNYVANDRNREKFINGVLFKDPFYLNITDPSPEFYPEIDLFFEEFKIIGRGKPLSAYVNFAQEPPSKPHMDTKDHFYWQCIGSTIWKFKDVEYRVEPGDVMYIPGYVQHDVITIGPRAAIQFEYKLHISKLQDIATAKSEAKNRT